MILIYMAYDIFYINEIPPSLPSRQHIHFSHDQAKVKAAVEFEGSRLPALHGAALLYQDLL